MDKLEFNEVIRLLGRYCFSDYGRSAIDRFMPCAHPRQELNRVRQMLDFLIAFGDPSLGGIMDIRGEVEWIRKGEILSPKQLLRVAQTFEGVDGLQTSVRSQGTAFPDLLSCMDEMHPQKDFVQKVRKTVDSEGLIRDSASPALKSIRSEMKTCERQLKRTLEQSLGGSLRDHLQDQVYFVRDGRYVLPIKASNRSQVRGIVHSTSASRATVYMETEALIALNDQLRDLQSQETEEVNRILREISQKLLHNLPGIDQTIEALVDFDGLYARGKYGLAHDAIIPDLHDDSIFSLISARHPLLGPQCVPLTIGVNREHQGIVITGPNTGGKTVALKTVGLIHMMGLSGIPVPAKRGTVLGSFHHILADIGDEQSIQQSLSTFSGHLKNITMIVKTVDSRSLVLLDELGAGTDPIEGAALALGLIDTLLSKGCYFLITSHLTPLKLYAYANPQLENAAVEFDLETLSPTYRLMVGVAGSSNAFEIARRLGLPDEVLKRAQTHLGREFDEVERIIRNLHEEKIQLEMQKEQSLHLIDSLKEKEDMLSEKIEKVRQKKYEEFMKDFVDMERELKKLKRSVETMLGELRREKKLELSQMERLNQQLHEIEELTLRPMKARMDDMTGHKEKGESQDYTFHVGDFVCVEHTRAICEVKEVRDRRVIVESEGIRMEVDARRLLPAEKPAVNKEPDLTPVYWKESTTGQLFSEIDVRGHTVEEAMEKIDDFLESLVVGRRKEGTIIHGKGTGKLAEGIWRALSADMRVRSYRVGKPQEGGTGVTVIAL